MRELIDLIQQHREALETVYKIIAGFVGVIVIVAGVAFKLGGRHVRRKINPIIQSKIEDAVRKSEGAYQIERARADLLEAEIRKVKELAYFKHWPYHPHDDPPRRVLCPKCQTVIQIKDDTAKVADDHGVERYEPALRLTCPKCELSTKLFGIEMKGLASVIRWICEKPEDSLIS